MSDGGPAHTGPLTPDIEGLRRLERRIARSLGAKAMARRVWESAPAIAQIVVAVLASYSIARFGLDHVTPILAVTVTITSLGFTRDTRPVRVLRSVLGILLGVAVATVLLMLIGQGVWQFALLLVAVMVVARALTTDATFAVVAATPAALTFLLPVPEGGPWLRALDGLIGGLVALLVTILIPRDPRRASLRDARAAYSLLVQAVGNVTDGLRDGDPAAAELGLNRLRRTAPLLEAWRQSLDTARAVARISPFLRSRLPELDRQARALRGAEQAADHLTHIARRSEYMVRDAGRHAALAGLVDQVGRGVELLGEELDDLLLTGAARSVLLDLARRLDPRTAVPGATPTEAAVVVQLRPLVVDLLVATGLPLHESQSPLPPL